MPIHPAWDEVGRSKAGLGALSAQHSHVFFLYKPENLGGDNDVCKRFPYLHYDEDDTAEVDGGLQGGDSLRWERSPMNLG